MIRIAVLLAMVVAPFSREAQPDASDQFLAEMRGEAIAQARCAVCHSIRRYGASPDPEAPPLRQLSQSAPLLLSDPGQNAALTTGHPVMPDFDLAPEVAADITAYIRSLEREEEPPFY